MQNYAKVMMIITINVLQAGLSKINREPNQKYQEQKPKVPTPKISVLYSVPICQEPKFSVRFGSGTRLTEEPNLFNIWPIKHLAH